MALYALIAPAGASDQALEAAVEKGFPGRFMKVSPGQFIVSSKLTTNQVSDHLGVRGGPLGRVLIVRVENYAGWHSKDLWEWMASPPSDSEELPPEAAGTSGA